MTSQITWFESTQQATSMPSNSSLPHGSAIEDLLSQVNSLTRHQRVNVKGTITTGDAKPKEVKERNGKPGLVNPLTPASNCQ